MASSPPTPPTPLTPPAPPTSAVAEWSLVALMERANALQAAGQQDAASDLYAQWIAHHPDAPTTVVALFNRGTLLSQMGQQEASGQCYSDALALNPGFAPAWLNLGHLHERLDRVEDALQAWAQVTDGQASQGGTSLEHRLHAFNQSARLLEQKKRYPEAEALMRRSLALKADQSDVIQHYVHIRQKQCAWPIYDPVGDVTPNQFLMGTSALAAMGLFDDPALQLLSAVRFAHDKLPKPANQPLWQRGPRREGKIRIGYLSGDLHHHAVGLLTAELFELHDRSRFEVFGFCWTPESNSPQRQRIRQALDFMIPLGQVNDAQAAELITRAGIDVLVDLQGLTSGARPAILGHRPAPVQVGYLGLPGTSAIPGLEWMLADAYVMPPELVPYCTEKPIYLPHCYQVSDRQRAVGRTPTRAEAGLPEQGFVFCSFNNNHKYTPEVFDAWMRILQQVPGSVLWLLSDNDTAKTQMRQRAERQGVVAERLIFAGRVAPPDYLARFQCADLVLDTFPYNAGTTASDVLWMGVPILTLSGKTYISRMAGSLLTAVGLPDLITTSLADYEQLAVTLGRNPGRIVSYKRYLAQEGRQSPLFDIPQIVRDIETEFERLARAARVKQSS